MKYFWVGIYIVLSMQIAGHAHARIVDTIQIAETEAIDTGAHGTELTSDNQLAKWSQAADTHSAPQTQNTLTTTANTDKNMPEPEIFLLIGLGVLVLIGKGFHRNR
ncbi:hypothetical protein [Iodobacter ciconiae]|uniref:PEP-CTERM protein-sorting domain-containing protein n=1 Tax=Iodobacter ciconiae TaxID=2496266 RepID=A0A3S8ZS58_9NEIS|nr:hypothetical protein [Iodobacter ciconiae]AZN36294.1 hypothetical protein EJO50_07215 [Iodobacter ciconiae]